MKLLVIVLCFAIAASQGRNYTASEQCAAWQKYQQLWWNSSAPAHGMLMKVYVNTNYPDMIKKLNDEGLNVVCKYHLQDSLPDRMMFNAAKITGFNDELMQQLLANDDAFEP